MNRLFCLLKVEELQYMNVISFIRLFNLVLAGLAIGSCIMCYNSTKKEELFIISHVCCIFYRYIPWKLYNMNLINSAKYIDGYITISTSLLRISILVIIFYLIRLKT